MFDDPLAEGGHRRGLQPVEVRQVGQDEGLDALTLIVRRRWASPLCATAAAPIKTNEPAARAAIDFGIDFIGLPFSVWSLVISHW